MSIRKPSPANRHKRAEQNVGSYLISTHELNATQSRRRVILAWLQGYDAAWRDFKKARK